MTSWVIAMWFLFASPAAPTPIELEPKCGAWSESCIAVFMVEWDSGPPTFYVSADDVEAALNEIGPWEVPCDKVEGANDSTWVECTRIVYKRQAAKIYVIRELKWRARR